MGYFVFEIAYRSTNRPSSSEFGSRDVGIEKDSGGIK